MQRPSHADLFAVKSLRIKGSRWDALGCGSLLTSCQWALALSILAVALSPQAAYATPSAGAIAIVAGSCPGPDSDGDGVGDACDNCPNTPGGPATFAQNVFLPIPEPASLTTCGSVTTSLARTITVDYPGIVFGVKLSLSLQHQVYSDVDIKLAHAGTVVTLNPVSSTSQIRNTSDLNGIYRFDDAAGVPLEYAANECFIYDCPTVAPGTYRPSGLLSAFTGTPASGDWTLMVSDGCRFGNTSPGTFDSWSLELIVALPDQSDYDYDGVGDLCDNCPASSFSTEGMDEVFAPIPDAAPGACDFSTTELTRTITISESGPVAFMEATLELDHTWYEDLDVQLEHNGTVVSLMSNDLILPDISANLGGTYTFADFAAQSLDEAALNCFFSGCPAITPGHYRSDEPLSAFYGMDARGDWTLTLRDTCFQNSGLLYLWTMSLFVQDASQADTDEDGMGDACDLCAAGAGKGDAEADGDFDLFDYEMMAGCLQGVGASMSPGCECFDFDGDGDVDLMDASHLALDYQPEPGCRINGVFYQPGESDAPPFACRTCQPQINRKDWTMATAGSVCRAAAGGCDIAEVCNGLSVACPLDAIQPSTYQCRPGVGGCDVAETCPGTSSACPPDVLRPNAYPCRPTAGVCDVAEVCNGTSGVCPADTFQPSSHVCASETGPNGEYLCREAVNCTGTSVPCPFPTITSYDPTRVCRASTFPCDPEEYCSGAGVCTADIRWSAGQVCPGASACELPYTCDAGGNCNANGLRSGTASCRAPANTCDERDYCGSCDAGGNCSSPFPPGDPRNRTDFTEYPECGPDKKKPDGAACTNGAFAGTCLAGQCVAFSNCNYNIDCPDGFVCNKPNCVQAPVDHGYGDTCVGKKVCDLNSPAQKIGTICTFPVDCRDATHPGANCVPGIFGDCGSDASGPLLCCAGMSADGIGTSAAPGQIGRCQQCCDSSFNGPLGCGDPFCCDGKCTDVETDPHNCGGCAYNGGLECDNLIDACNPSVLGCAESQCIMGNACSDLDPICSMSDTITVPDPACSFCTPALTLDPSLVYTGCGSDSDCTSNPQLVITGSCHRVTGRCTPDSAHPNEECTTNSDCQDATMQGSCWDYCFGLFNFAAGNSPTINIPVGNCSAPPYTGCTLTCEPPPSGALPPNVGSQCEDDSDCHSGTTCQTSCHISDNAIGWYLLPFCFSNPTCQW